MSVIVKLPLLKQKKACGFGIKLHEMRMLPVLQVQEELLQWCSARRLVGKGAISESLGSYCPDVAATDLSLSFEGTSIGIA